MLTGFVAVTAPVQGAIGAPPPTLTGATSAGDGRVAESSVPAPAPNQPDTATSRRRADFLSQARGHMAVDALLYDGPHAPDAALQLPSGSGVDIGGRLEVAVGLGARSLYWVRADLAGQVRYGFIAADAVHVSTGEAAWLDLAAADPVSWSQPGPAEDYRGRAPGAPHVEAPSAPDLGARDDGVLASTASQSDGDLGATPIAWMPATVGRWWPQIQAAAEVEGLDPRLVAIVVLVESGGNPAAGSSAGARGLMQLMPATAAELSGQLGLGSLQPDQLWQPELNLRLGARYLAQQLDRFGADADPDSQVAVERAAAAYNGGPGRAMAHISGERALPAETRSYVTWVGGLWRDRGAARSATLDGWLAAGGRHLVEAARIAEMGSSRRSLWGAERVHQILSSSMSDPAHSRSHDHGA